MGINWIGGGGVIGGGGFFAAIGGIVAVGFVIHFWQIFALMALALVILHCLAPKPKPLSYSCTIEELRERVAAAQKD